MWIKVHDHLNVNFVMVRVEQINFFMRDDEFINPNGTVLSFGDDSIHVRESVEEICKMIGCV